MNGTLLLVLNIFFYVILTIYILVKEVVIPKRNNRKNNEVKKESNPINIDRFYQEFKDFKEAQCKWNDKIEIRLDRDDQRLDDLERG